MFLMLFLCLDHDILKSITHTFNKYLTKRLSYLKGVVAIFIWSFQGNTGHCLSSRNLDQCLAW